MTRRMSFRTPERVRTREDVLPIRKTTATLRQKATAAFMKSMRRPASVMAWILNVGPSKMMQHIPFISAHT